MDRHENSGLSDLAHRFERLEERQGQMETRLFDKIDALSGVVQSSAVGNAATLTRMAAHDEQLARLNRCSETMTDFRTETIASLGMIKRIGVIVSTVLGLAIAYFRK